MCSAIFCRIIDIGTISTRSVSLNGWPGVTPPVTPIGGREGDAIGAVGSAGSGGATGATVGAGSAGTGGAVTV